MCRSADGKGTWSGSWILGTEAAQARAQAAAAEEATAAAERHPRHAFPATLVGAAMAAKEAGQPFFEIQLEVGRHAGSAGSGTADGRRTTASSAGVYLFRNTALPESTA